MSLVCAIIHLHCILVLLVTLFSLLSVFRRKNERVKEKKKPEYLFQRIYWLFFCSFISRGMQRQQKMKEMNVISCCNISFFLFTRLISSIRFLFKLLTMEMTMIVMISFSTYLPLPFVSIVL